MKTLFIIFGILVFLAPAARSNDDCNVGLRGFMVSDELTKSKIVPIIEKFQEMITSQEVPYGTFNDEFKTKLFEVFFLFNAKLFPFISSLGVLKKGVDHLLQVSELPHEFKNVLLELRKIISEQKNKTLELRWIQLTQGSRAEVFNEGLDQVMSALQDPELTVKTATQLVKQFKAGIFSEQRTKEIQNAIVSLSFDLYQDALKKDGVDGVLEGLREESWNDEKMDHPFLASANILSQAYPDILERRWYELHQLVHGRIDDTSINDAAKKDLQKIKDSMVDRDSINLFDIDHYRAYFQATQEVWQKNIKIENPELGVIAPAHIVDVQFAVFGFDGKFNKTHKSTAMRLTSILIRLLEVEAKYSLDDEQVEIFKRMYEIYPQLRENRISAYTENIFKFTFNDQVDSLKTFLQELKKTDPAFDIKKLRSKSGNLNILEIAKVSGSEKVWTYLNSEIFSKLK